MDELYFVCSYHDLRSRLDETQQSLLDDALIELCDKGFVDPLGFENGDFIRLDQISIEQLAASSFLNTKKGLLWLHGMDKTSQQ
jgi:hypothetical protein